MIRVKLPAAVAVVSSTMLLGLPVDARALAPPVVSTQATAANAAFLAYAPPAPKPAAMCLVDTGVNPNPDTTPALVYEAALDGGSPKDTDPEGHGTIMATIAGGQGHGLRGIWPQIKIVSIRAASTPPPGQAPAYQYANYVEALQKCLEHSSLNVKTVNLSLSSPIPPTSDQAQKFSQTLNELVSRGIAVVAAAGNAPGKVQYPGGEPGVLSVGAGTIAGGTCSFSATEGVGIFAPGCELDFANPLTDEYASIEYIQGTSEASDIADTALTALMDYGSLPVAQAENLLVTTAVSGHLNVAGAFEAAGLGSIVAAGNAAIPPELSPSTSPVIAPAAKGVPAASIRSVAWRHGVLILRLRSLPKGADVHVQALYSNRRAKRLASTKRTLRLRCAKPSQVDVWITEGTTVGPTSKIPLNFHARTPHRRADHAKGHSKKA
jgi:Subtilase family